MRKLNSYNIKNKNARTVGSELLRNFFPNTKIMYRSYSEIYLPTDFRKCKILRSSPPETCRAP